MKDLDDVIAHFGSITALAEALDVTTQAISYWKAKGGIPLQRAYQIEVLTGGVFKAASLTTRPPMQTESPVSRSA